MARAPSPFSSGEADLLLDFLLTDFSLERPRSDFTLEVLLERDLRSSERERDLRLVDRLRDLCVRERERDLRLRGRDLVDGDLERDLCPDLERERCRRERDLQKTNSS